MGSSPWKKSVSVGVCVTWVRSFYLLTYLNLPLSHAPVVSLVLSVGLAVVYRIPRAREAAALQTDEGCFPASIRVYDKLASVVQTASAVVAEAELVVVFVAAVLDGVCVFVVSGLCWFWVRSNGVGGCCPVGVCVHSCHSCLSSVFLRFCLPNLPHNPFQFSRHIEEN